MEHGFEILPGQDSEGTERAMAGPELPTGTLTFLLSDVEGSTELWEQDPPAMRLALATHDAIMTAGIREHHGTPIKSRGEGDSLFAVFTHAVDAVAAACSLQRRLLAEEWPTSTPFRVRMALHSGEAELRDADYYGLAVNRCARLRDAAHGGQVLLSWTTQDLARGGLPDEVALEELGSVRLRHLQRPETVFQLRHPGLPAAFPPLRTHGAPPTNLPQQVSSFIGREREIAEVKRILSPVSSDCRLLTLTGSGGTGKTRLALRVAADLLERYEDGVWLVELAPLSDPDLVPQAVAMVLGTRASPGRPMTQTVVESLKTKRMLLLLDNCEHLLGACAILADTLLRACPGVQILATSRERLNLSGATSYRLPSLSLPDRREPLPPETLTRYEAVHLFLDRAAAAVPSFTLTDQNTPAVVEVCRRLDGIPLAIELAAVRVNVLSIERIVERLDDRFRLLTGGSATALPRHQTLQAAMDWSYDLLSEPERALLARLSVFAGGWTLEAAEAVCADRGPRVRPETPQAEAPAGRRKPQPAIGEDPILDLLTALVEKSLVIYDGDEERYRLLETVRHYGGDRLAESGAAAVHARHRDFFLALAEEAEPQLQGAVQAAWCERLETEHDNFRTALDWCVCEPGGDVEAGLRLAAALWRFWVVRGYFLEGRQRLTAAAARAGNDATNLRAKALTVAGTLAYYQADLKQAQALCEESLALAREGGHQWSMAVSLVILGICCQLRDYDYARAAALFEQGLTLAREVEDPWLLAISCLCRAQLAFGQGDAEQVGALLRQSLALFQELGDQWFICTVLTFLGMVSSYLGEHQAARSFQRECLPLSLELKSELAIAQNLEGLAAAWQVEGQVERAARLFGAADALREAISTPLDPVEQQVYDRPMAALRASLGDQAYAAARAVGRAMPLQHAVEEALSAATSQTLPPAPRPRGSGG
jgi:predicted ATPase/class 3 adenylate cyclase